MSSFEEFPQVITPKTQAEDLRDVFKNFEEVHGQVFIAEQKVDRAIESIAKNQNDRSNEIQTLIDVREYLVKLADAVAYNMPAVGEAQKEIKDSIPALIAKIDENLKKLVN